MARRVVKIELTPAQARVLLSLAEEGAQGLLNDDAACRAYIGGAAQVRACRIALDKLAAAVDALPRVRRRRPAVRY